MTFISAFVVDEEDFEVLHEVVILWNLANLLNRQQLVIDIGLHIKAGPSPIRRFGLTLPFAVRHISEWSDISGNLKNEGRPSLVGAAGSTDSVSPTLHEVSYLDNDSQAYRGKGLFRRARNRWTKSLFQLASPIPPGGEGVVRIRFFIYGPTGMVVWKRSGFAVNGLTLEFGPAPAQLDRVPNGELKQLVTAKGRHSDSLQMTVVLRASLDVKTSFPESTPVLLTHQTWGNYLGRVTDLRDQGALVAYSYVSTDISPSLFLSATRENGLLGWGNAVRSALLTLAVVVGLVATGLIARGHAQPQWSPLQGFNLLWTGLGLLGLGGAVLLVRLTSFLRTAVRYCWIQSGRLERGVFTLLLTYYSRN